jgi:hypothetical protein
MCSNLTLARKYLENDVLNGFNFRWFEGSDLSDEGVLFAFVCIERVFLFLVIKVFEI